MSNMRDKAREVKEAGVAERGNFEPNGVPLRIYKWWLEESESKRAYAIRSGSRKENFCHFWRVVLFWAPLRKTGYVVKPTLPYAAAALVLAALAVFVYALFTVPSVLVFVLQLLGIVLAILLAAGGLIGGTTLGMSPKRRRENDMPPNKFAVPAAILGLPTAILAFIVTKAICYYRDHLRAYDLQFGVTAAVLAVAGVATFVGFAAGWLALLWSVLSVVGLAILVFGVIIGVSVLSDYVSGKRDLERQRAWDAEEAYYKEHGHFPEKVAREPGRIAKFFSGLGDFIVLIAQVVRVNKWKICPLVEVDTK